MPPPPGCPPGLVSLDMVTGHQLTTKCRRSMNYEVCGNASLVMPGKVTAGAAMRELSRTACDSNCSRERGTDV